jgi:hypothetical protein
MTRHAIIVSSLCLAALLGIVPASAQDKAAVARDGSLSLQGLQIGRAHV